MAGRAWFALVALVAGIGLLAAPAAAAPSDNANLHATLVKAGLRCR